ncbi:MAG: AraC family ligand binding domain-containing protein, partial [Cellulosilyticaceae bacterium]
MINYDFRSIHNRSDFDFKVEIDLLRGGFEVHTHSFYELVIILGGHGIHNINHEKHFIKRGDVFILMPHTSHYFSDNENLFVCNIMFANLDSIMSLDDYKLLPGFHTLFVLS